MDEEYEIGKPIKDKYYINSEGKKFYLIFHGWINKLKKIANISFKEIKKGNK
jgi:hypothetical protein